MCTPDAKAQARLRICAGSSGDLLIADAISTETSCVAHMVNTITECYIILNHIFVFLLTMNVVQVTIGLIS